VTATPAPSSRRAWHSKDMAKPPGVGLSARGLARAPFATMLRRGLTLSQLWAVVIVSAFGILALGRRVNFVDLGYHLRAGAWMWSHGRILDHDVFTSTFAGDAWLNQNWLTQLLFYKSWDLAGLEGLAGLIAVLFTGGFALSYWVAYRRAGEVRVAGAAMLIAALPSIYNTAARPQAISWLLTAVVVAILERSEDRPGLTLWIVPLTALWANLHGAFVIGLGFVAIELIAAAWAGRRDFGARRRRAWLAVTLGGAALAALANPWGYRVYAYVAGIGTNATIRGAIEEWQAPALGDPAGVLFFVSVGLVALALLRAPARLDLRDGLRLLFGLALGAVAIRNGLWWTLAAGPALATLVARPPAPVGSERPRIGHLAVVGALIALAVVFSPWTRPQLLDDDTPVAAAAYLRDRDLPGNLLNSQHYGSYLEWAAPASPTFLDSRIELFPPGLWADYQRLVAAQPGWAALTKRYNIGHVVLDASRHEPLRRALGSSAEWELVHVDERAVVYAQRGRAD
jgi:hypothetical protein